MSSQTSDSQWSPDFPEAKVSLEARIGKSVSIGPGTIVYGDVEIGDGARIGEHCVLGVRGPEPWSPLIIGKESVIRSHSVVYSASRFGDRLETGHHVVIRERTIAGDNLRIGNFCDIEGDCSFGDYCRMHGYAHVGKGTKVGNFVWLFSLTTATNDPLPPSMVSKPVNIADGAVVCVGATLMPGTSIGMGAFVSAGAHAHGDIPAGAVVAGLDGKIVSHVSTLVHFETGTRHPWMRHFDKGYPPSTHSRLSRLKDEIIATREQLVLPPS
jgi:UDP-3-O-[3-hydroxymyristoyl] glucosamine N-acyltransferase